MRAPRMVTTCVVSIAAAGALLLSGCGSGATASGMTCVEGSDCAVGDTGPGGGVVFYRAEVEQPWGRYLEAAPDGWNQGGQDPLAVWCDNTKSKLDGAWGKGIGSGAANTQALVEECASVSAVLADDYSGGGKEDWFLPSRDELVELYKQRDMVDDADDQYWSSSQSDAQGAWSLNFQNGSLYQQSVKDSWLFVRPVRAF